MPLGRPPVLDDVKRGEICALLTAGLKFAEVAGYVGCTTRTIRREIRRNAPFRRSVHDALLAARLAPEKLLRQAAGRNWRAAAWLLERTDPQTYARRSPGGCTPQDLDDACRWIIDAALHEIHYEQRTGLFHTLTAIVRDVQGQVRRRANQCQPLRTPPTDFYDLASKARELSGGPIDDAILSAGDDGEADRKPASCVPSATAEHSQRPASSARERRTECGS